MVLSVHSQTTNFPGIEYLPRLPDRHTFCKQGQVFVSVARDSQVRVVWKIKLGAQRILPETTPKYQELSKSP
jgi:hypothetical protein